MEPDHKLSTPCGRPCYNWKLVFRKYSCIPTGKTKFILGSYPENLWNYQKELYESAISHFFGNARNIFKSVINAMLLYFQESNAEALDPSLKHQCHPQRLCKGFDCFTMLYQTLFDGKCLVWVPWTHYAKENLTGHDRRQEKEWKTWKVCLFFVWLYSYELNKNLAIVN